MEQEPQSPPLYPTVKRVTYRVRLVAHFLFIIIALIGTISLLSILLLQR